MSARVVIDKDWRRNLREVEAGFLDTQVGPEIVQDMHRFCPVDTGRLDGSLGHQVVTDDAGVVPELQVGSFPDEEGEVEYAAAVEFGFHGEELVREHRRRSKNGVEHTVREHTRHANTPEQPYIRPAVYQERFQ